MTTPPSDPMPTETPGFRDSLRRILFDSDSRAGRLFNGLMLGCILLSVVSISLETVEAVAAKHGQWLRIADWVFTALFTLEYIGRLTTARRPMRYATSFFGLVDLAAILPAFITLLLPGTHELLVIRVLRLVRLFRIFKLAEYVGESAQLAAALRASRPKIVVFLIAVLTIVVVLGAAMHLVEGPQHGFTSIPQSMYWAIVTMTTVGYGDLIPVTPVGKLIASAVMILGYGLLAVPTGIVTSELTWRARARTIGADRSCAVCAARGHPADAIFCRICGVRL